MRLLNSVSGSLFLTLGCLGVSLTSMAQMDDGGFVGDNGYDTIKWYFPCPVTSQIQVPAANQGEIVLKGIGPFDVEKEYVINAKTEVYGEICEASKLRRDVIFVIDMSGSMSSSDPLKDGTCGRLQGFQAALKTFDWTTTNVGLVMFDDDVDVSTTALHSSEASLISELTNTGLLSIEDILCANNGGTDYAVALKETAKMFESLGRDFATKEILFVSDGEPNDATAAKNEATKLKTKGVSINGRPHLATIATIYVSTYSGAQVILKEMASRDVNNTPLFATSKNVEQLAQLLKDFAEKNKLEGSNVAHGGTLSAPATIDVMPYVVDWNFALPPFFMDLRNSPRNYFISLEYWDTNRNTYKIPGQINWK